MKTFNRKLFVLCLAVIVVFALSLVFAACDNTQDELPPEGYKLTYAKGAYAATGEAPDQWYEEGEEVTLADASTFALDGHIINKWSDGTDEYEPGSTFIMPAHDVKLTAKWIQGDPNAPVVTATSVGFAEGYFVVCGTVKNVNALYVYLNNTNVSDSNNNYVQAEISDNTFTARLSLSTLLGYAKNNTPFNLRCRINSTSSEMLGVAKGSLDLSATCHYNEYDFRLAVNSGTNCVAVYYDPAPDTTVVVTATSIEFDEGYFVVNGNVQGVNNLYIYLINTNHAETLDNYVEAQISNGSFTARLSLATLVEKGGVTTDPFNLRYRANDSTININIPQGTLDITQTHSFGGNDFRLGINNGCVAVYYSPTPVPPEPNEPDYTFSVSDMYFSNGKFVVEGICGADVKKLIFHIHNTNAPVTNITFAAVITEGTFKAEIALSDIKREDGSDAHASYLNVRYEMNDDGYKQLNILPGKDGHADYVAGTDYGQEYRYGDRTWKLRADTSRTYLEWSAVTDAYRLSEIKLELDTQGKPVLTIAGTTTDVTIEADKLRLLLDKTMGDQKEQKYIENSETEAGKFRFTIDLTDLIASIDTATASQQQAYFIRLYNGTTKIADVNSRWASDLLWGRAKIETEDAVYFLMKNTEWNNKNWNTLGIVKVEKH